MLPGRKMGCMENEEGRISRLCTEYGVRGVPVTPSYSETTLNFEIFSVKDHRGVLSVIANLAAG